MSYKIWQAASDAAQSGEAAALITVTSINGSAPRKAGSVMLLFSDGQIMGTIGGGAFEYHVIQQGLKVINSGRPEKIQVHLTRDLGMCCGGYMEAFIEAVQPVEQLVVYGGGHVGTAIAWLASRLDFQVTVVDEREDWAEAERFPPDCTVIEADPRLIIDKLPFGSHCYHFVTTHSHALDQDIIQSMIGREFAWLGMIGSRSKKAKFLMRFRAAELETSIFEELATPAGLDIGAQTPMEIAVSLASEIIRIRHSCTDRPVQPLSFPGKEQR